MRLLFLVLLLSVLVIFWLSCRTASVQQLELLAFDQYPTYTGNDLGMRWMAAETRFKLWSPAAGAVRLHLYPAGNGGSPEKTLLLKRGKNGVWETTLPGNVEGKYYTVQVQYKGKWLDETPDPYAVATGVNGQRAMIVNPAKATPPGWEKDVRPARQSFTDIILYELHVRDLSSDPNSGIKNTGKFLGLTESGARNSSGQSTGLDHIRELGVTHVHLLPSFDFRWTSIDESKPAGAPQYNWGYDPENYNVPEGSFSTNPYNGYTRMLEFKQAIQALHQNGIGVVMDVVYNHTGSTDASVFNRVAPGYYYRQNADGSFSNASACGNETASERPMMRQYIIESVLYWAREYHIDGFRFDLMGIHDIETMNAVSQALHAIDPHIFIYGEGWTAGSSPLPDAQRALKANTHRLDKIAAFSDDFRDALKGSVFDHHDRGFISGKSGMEESIKFGIVASTQHPQIDYAKVNYSKAPWAKEPFQTITYVDCHDNHTLWDKLTLSCPEASESDKIRMQQLAAAMVLTSQGVPFLHAGAEMLRSKQGVENSFQSPDDINKIDWNRKAQYPEVFAYYKHLVQLRKKHPAFRLASADLIRKHLTFMDMEGSNLIAYTLSNNAGGDTWNNIFVVFNGNRESRSIQLPAGKWTVVLDDREYKENGLRTVARNKVDVPGISAMILVSD